MELTPPDVPKDVWRCKRFFRHRLGISANRRINPVQNLFAVEEEGFFRAETYAWYIEHGNILLTKLSELLLFEQQAKAERGAKKNAAELSFQLRTCQKVLSL